MALPHRRARAHLLLLPLVLAVTLAGCGGAPHGPVLPGESPGAAVPDDAKARAASLTRLGDTALRSGETETAVGLLEQATLTDGGNVAPALGLGNALLAAGRDLDASRAFERALAIQPGSPEARYGYARAMIAIQRPEVAAEHLRKLAAENPSNVAALNALGVAYDLLGDHAAASGTYRQALAVLPASDPVRNNLALSLALQDQFADALELLRPLAEGPSATRRARQNLALVYGLQGDLGAAERLGRIDLGGDELRNNLAYFASVRGLESPTVRAAALAPEQLGGTLEEPRLTRRSKSARKAASVVQPPPEEPGIAEPRAAPTAAPAPATPQAGPRPLAPILEGQRGDAAADRGAWFADLGSFERPAATELWRKLRADHPSALAGMERLASAGGAGAEPLLLGPIASEQAARDLCGMLQPSVASCRPTSL